MDLESVTMDKLQAENVQVVIKTVGNEGIMIQEAKKLNDKNEIKTTEYFLNVDQSITEESNDAQFVPVESENEETSGAQYVTMEVGDAGQLILHNKDVIIYDELCRICANASDRFIPIFNDEGLEHNLQEKIQAYLPVQVSENDTLPLQVCYNCAATLLSWHELYKNCLDAQQRLMELQSKLNSKDQYYNDSTVEEENVENVLEVETSNNEEIQADNKDENCMETMQIVTASDLDSFSDGEPKSKEITATQTIEKYTYMCGVCDQLFDLELELMQHLQTIHNTSLNRLMDRPIRYECNVCNKSYVHKAKLINHMETHTRNLPGEDGVIAKSRIFINGLQMYKCPECSKQMSTRRIFLRHLRVHNDERPIVCHLCGKSYRIEEDLTRHVNDVHKKIKRFACDLCGTSFASKSTRDAHRRIHTGEKPFQCSQCSKKFCSINLLGIHKRTHTNYRPHQCSYCEKAFRDRQKLTIHECIHTGERPFACDVCGKLFAAKSECVRHRTIHSDEKPFLCSQCGLSFRLNKFLLLHMRQHHKDKNNTESPECQPSETSNDFQ